MPSRVVSKSAVSRIQQPVMGLVKYLSTSDLESNLLHLIYLRASQINGCAYCMSMHTRDLLLAGERADRTAVVSAWRESSWFTPREQAALAFTEAVTRLEHQHVPDDVFENARTVFSEQELADLTLAVATINVWNRIAITWQFEPEAFTPPAANLDR